MSQMERLTLSLDGITRSVYCKFNCIIVNFEKTQLLCISTSKCMLAHEFAWSKMMKNI